MRKDKVSLRRIAPAALAVPLLLIATGFFSASCDEDADPTGRVLPTATPGMIAATATPTVLQSEVDGALQVAFDVMLQGSPQRGVGVLRQVGRGTHINITVIPGEGVIQQVNIREGRCDAVGKWVDTIEPAIGGVSRSDLHNIHIRDLVDGNHLISVSIPGGTFSEVATCGELPDLSHLDIPDEAG